MPEPLTIVVPMAPASEMFPNRRHRSGGLYPGIAASTKCRTIAKAVARDIAPREAISGPVELTIHAGYGYRRVVPDLDATISAVKPFIDGLVDAGVLVDDRQIVRITATHEKLRSNRRHRAEGYTELTIREVAEHEEAA